MENSSPEIKLHQESEPKIILCPEEVEKIYKKTELTSKDYGKRKYLDTPVIHGVFSQDRLDENRGDIKILLAQLFPDFFNQETNGALFSKININKDGVCWDREGKSSNHFLALILASNLAKVATSRSVASSGPSKYIDSYNILAEK